MSTEFPVIQIKRTSDAGKKPTADILRQGELALNLADKKIYTKDHLDQIVELCEYDVEPPFSPTNVIYLDVNGFEIDDGANGTRNFPFKLVEDAIDHISTLPDGEYTLILSGGTFVGNIESIPGKELSIRTFAQSTIDGTITIKGTSINIDSTVKLVQSDDTKPIIDVRGITKACIISAVLTQSTGSQTLIDVNSRNGNWTGTLTLNLPSTTGRIVTNSTGGKVVLHTDSPGLDVAVNGSTVVLVDSVLGEVAHTDGDLVLVNTVVGKSESSPAINSTANTGSIVLDGVNTHYAQDKQSYITKLGTCGYSIANTTRNLSLDANDDPIEIFNGTRTSFRRTYDVDVVVTHRAENYTSGSASLRDHIGGIDEELGKKLSEIATLEPVGVDLVADTAGVLRSLLAGDNIEIEVNTDGQVVITGTTIPHFRESHLLHVDKNGSDTSGDGSSQNPFLTIAHAISVAAANTAILVGPGIFKEDITFTKQIALIGSVGTTQRYATTIDGTFEIDGAVGQAVTNVRLMNQDVAKLTLSVKRVGSTLGVHFKDVAVSGNISANGSSWTGQLVLNDCFIPNGQLTIAGTANVDIRDLIAREIDITVTAGQLTVNDANILSSVMHLGGKVILRDIGQLGKTDTIAGLTSTAMVDPSNLLILKDINTWVSETSQSFINKTGTCDYNLDLVTLNFKKDVFTGKRLNQLTTNDRLTLVGYEPINYTIDGSLLADHLAGIDQRLAAAAEGGGTIANVIFVDKSGVDTNTGEMFSPLATITKAIDIAKPESVILVGPGTYNELLTLGSKDVSVVALDRRRTIIDGTCTLSGALGSTLTGITLSYDTAGQDTPILKIDANTSGSFKLSDVHIKARANQLAIDTPSGIASTGTVTLTDCSIPTGRVIFGSSTGTINVIGSHDTSFAAIDMYAGTVEFNHMIKLDSVIHRGGHLTVSTIQSAGVSTDKPAILSVAGESDQNSLRLFQLSTWIDGTSQSYIDKSGACDYTLDLVTRNFLKDTLLGNKSPRSHVHDMDAIGLYAPLNYEAEAGDTLYKHLEEIDKALGTSGTVFNITDASDAGESLIHKSTGVLRTIEGTSGVTISVNETSGLISFTGGYKAGTGVNLVPDVADGTIIISSAIDHTTIQGLEGDIELVSDNITIEADEATKKIKLTATATLPESDLVETMNGLFGDIVIVGKNAAKVTTDPDNNRIEVDVELPDVVTTVNGMSGEVSIVEGEGVNMVVDVSTGAITLSTESGDALQYIENVPYSGDLTTLPIITDDGKGTKVAKVRQLVGGYNVTLSEDDGAIRFDVLTGAGTVKTINSIGPDNPESGNVVLAANHVGAISRYGDTVEGTLEFGGNHTVTNLRDATDPKDALTVSALNNGLFAIDQGTF